MKLVDGTAPVTGTPETPASGYRDGGPARRDDHARRGVRDHDLVPADGTEREAARWPSIQAWPLDRTWRRPAVWA